MIADLPHCPAPGQIIEIAAEPQSLAADALAVVLEPFQPLREQFTAITGLGLEFEDLPPQPVPQPLRRGRLPGENGLSVLMSGQRTGQRVIFLHGSPGVGEEWMRFLVEVPQDRLYLAPDRPGFGNSGEAPVTDLAAQAGAVAPLLPGPGGAQEAGQNAGPGALLVGYSYGGPVALRLALDHPGQVAGVLLIGAAADPALEETHPLQELAALEFFAQLLPVELANSNAELMALQEDLEQLGPRLAGLTVPVTIVQGMADTLVPPGNVDYLRAHLPEQPGPATILIEDADHFLPWTHHELLASALDCLLGQAQSADLSSAGK